MKSSWLFLKAARRQARIDQGKDVIVGVNKYQLENKPPLQALQIEKPPHLKADPKLALRNSRLKRAIFVIEISLGHCTSHSV